MCDKNEWQRVTPKRKPNEQLNNDRSVKPKLIIVDKNLTNTTLTQNRFQPLANGEKISDSTSSEENSESSASKVPKPPPIFIPDVADVKPLIKMLDGVAKENYFIKTIGNNQIKLQTTETNYYREIVNLLKVEKVNFHTYQLKQDRTYRAVIRNLHHTTDIEELKSDIEKKGHLVTNIYNIKNRISKEPLPIFFIELKPNQNNKEIFEIKYLQHTRVIIEPPKPRKEIPQCSTCQRYGHTKAYCFRNPRCVKCSENHLTKDCTKDDNSPVKCALCQGNHPASYKGCNTYREMQKRKFPPLRARTLDQNQNTLATKINANISYAQAARANTLGETPTEPIIEIEQNNSKLEKMMSNLIQRMDTILNLLTTLISTLSK